jgi:hypothetical protein
VIKENSTTAWKLWLSWISGAFLALILGLVLLIFGAGEAITNAPPAVFGLVIGVIFGTGLGLAQWFALRKRLAGISLWVPITIGVWVVFWSMNFAGLFGEGEGVTGKLVEGIFHGGLLGALTGTGQWFVLRSKTRKAHWWILISALSWAIGASTGDTIQEMLQIDIPLELIIAILLSSALTGAGMVWLLKQAEKEKGKHVNG